MMETKDKLMQAITEFKKEYPGEFHAYTAIAWLSGYRPEMNIKDAYEMVNGLLKDKVIVY